MCALGDFDAEWLRLRAPADTRARAPDLPFLLRPYLPKEPALRVLDLGCGTGSNLRVLAPRLGGPQHWLCLDTADDLLERVAIETGTWAEATGCAWDRSEQRITRSEPHLSCILETRRFDLSKSLADLAIDGVGLVTASALLDLVSEKWLGDLVARCAAVRAPMLMALIYDGRVSFEPELNLDRDVIDHVNRHQGRDKGFGPALGPSASARLAALATAHGYWVEIRTSDWKIGRSERALQAALIRGWCRAACEQAPDAETAAIRHWQGVRLAAVERGCSRIRVGHRDLLAIPRPA